MRKKELYKVHRLLSFIIGIPVFLWAISGLLHPLMTSVRPHINTQAAPLDSLTPLEAVHFQSLLTICMQHGIHRFYKTRLININKNWYYQVQTSADTIPIYINANDGMLLPKGDQVYATMLACHFLGDSAAMPLPDPVQRLTGFTKDYKYVNRQLPVYRVGFNREDSIAIYVDTQESRFSFAEDKHRNGFNRFFAFFHTWSWLDNYPKSKAGIITGILCLALFTSALGLYIAFTTNGKKKKGHRLLKARRLHRITALVAAFFVVAWAFSGTLHALVNSLSEARGFVIDSAKMDINTLPADLPQKTLSLVEADNRPVLDLAYLSIAGEPALRVQFDPVKNQSKQDLMKEMRVTAPRSSYIRLSDWTPITDGDKRAAIYLARKQLKGVAGEANWKTPKTSYLTSFNEVYNFSDKVLPVWEVSPDGTLGHTVFIDTKSGRLTKKASRLDQADALCFAFFHKHEFMAWAGKSAKDASTIIGVLLVITMLVFGYRLFYISWRKKK